MRRTRRKGFTLVELLVVIGIIGLLLAILLPGLNQAMKSAQKTKCAANLHSIGQGLKIYSSGNKSKYPTVFVYVAMAAQGTRPASTVSSAWDVDTAWSPDAVTMPDSERGTEDVLLNTMTFKCNISAFWTLIRMEMTRAETFICPTAGMTADTTAEPERWWSFTQINNCSYSYQNQLYNKSGPNPYKGGNTTETSSSNVIVAADVNPLRPDSDQLVLTPKGVLGRYAMNSPNHDYTGQNCLYADGHVEWTENPDCGIRGNNIWLQSIPAAAGSTSSDPLWTGEDNPDKYADKGSTCAHKDDTYLVP